MSEDEALEMVSGAIGRSGVWGPFESWFEGKTLTVMVPDDGDKVTRFVKLRLVGILDRPSSADLRGEQT